MKHISFPKIGQFRNVVRTVKETTCFDGLDEDGKAKFVDRPLPTIKATGTVKLHGTNAGVSYNNTDGIWYQSRKNVITPTKDNAGFAFFADARKAQFMEIFQQIVNRNNLDVTKNTVTIYGEWAGKGIQKGVAISELEEKGMFIFGIKVSDLNDPETSAYWLDCARYRDIDNRIYNIYDYKTYELDIDFNQPELVVEKLIAYTNEVEEMCPVGKALGHEGTGEGIVWTLSLDDDVLRFKTKGEKHSVTKVKTLAPVDVEKLNTAIEFVEYAVTENRMQQGLDLTFPDGRLDVKKLGEFLKWLSGDVVKEESDTMTENKLEPKDVCKLISKKGRDWFFQKLKSF